MKFRLLQSLFTIRRNEKPEENLTSVLRVLLVEKNDADRECILMHLRQDFEVMDFRDGFAASNYLKK